MSLDAAGQKGYALQLMHTVARGTVPGPVPGDPAGRAPTPAPPSGPEVTAGRGADQHDRPAGDLSRKALCKPPASHFNPQSLPEHVDVLHGLSKLRLSLSPASALLAPSIQHSLTDLKLFKLIVII